MRIRTVVLAVILVSAGAALAVGSLRDPPAAKVVTVPDDGDEEERLQRRFEELIMGDPSEMGMDGPERFWADLEMGECFNADLSPGRPDTVTISPCDVPHEHQVYALLDYRYQPGVAYPSNEDLNGFLTDGCYSAIYSFVGVNHNDTLFRSNFNILAPKLDEWGEHHTFFCILSANEQTGLFRASLKDAGV